MKTIRTAKVKKAIEDARGNWIELSEGVLRDTFPSDPNTATDKLISLAKFVASGETMPEPKTSDEKIREFCEQEGFVHRMELQDGWPRHYFKAQYQ